MKTSSSILAYVSLSLVIMGSLFKIMHWPGAGVMLVVGITAFAFVFIPLFTVFRIKANTAALNVLESIAFAGSSWLLSLGLLFKVQHWPGAAALLTLGLLALCLVFIPIFLLVFIREKEYRKSANIIGLMICIAGFSMVLALKTGKDILNAFIINNELVSSNLDLNIINNERTYNLAMESTSVESQGSIEEVHNQSVMLVELIEKYKIHLITVTEGMSEDLPKEEYELKYLSQTDNYDIPSIILMGSDPSFPKTGEWTANMLKNELMEFKSLMLKHSRSEQTKFIIEEHFNLEDPIDARGIMNVWEAHYFYHMPLSSSVTLLSSFQNKVLEVSTMAMNELGRESIGVKD